MWRNDFLPNPKSQMGANHSITETVRNIAMLKSTLVAAAFAIAFIQPAFAMDAVKCDDASMMKMQTEMDAMTGAAMKKKKEMAMKEMDMAKKAMKEKKTDDCMMHMEGAMKAMKK
jgi:hypothetical protein